ncbi:Aldo/keto reductase [Trametopsis cervina]|nr:Aldo/keto reductase [Trametopsis cervina]
MATAKMIYGTAWKKERTAALVVSAVLSGFRAIDTAGQPKHYREDLVGEALEILQKEHNIRREDLFLQTKFTSLGGHDLSKPIPYNPNSRLETQINDSFNNSLKNLRTTFIDSYILHSPLETLSRTITAWKALMSLQDSGKVKYIGVSNTYDVSVLEALERDGGRRVQVVQNRWFEGNGWDAKVLSYCRKQGPSGRSPARHPSSNAQRSRHSPRQRDALQRRPSIVSPTRKESLRSAGPRMRSTCARTLVWR